MGVRYLDSVPAGEAVLGEFIKKSTIKQGTGPPVQGDHSEVLVSFRVYVDPDSNKSVSKAGSLDCISSAQSTAESGIFEDCASSQSSKSDNKKSLACAADAASSSSEVLSVSALSELGSTISKLVAAYCVPSGDTVDEASSIHDASSSPSASLKLGEILPIGLRLCLETMCAGSRAIVWLHPLAAFGSSGLISNTRGVDRSYGALKDFKAVSGSTRASTDIGREWFCGTPSSIVAPDEISDDCCYLVPPNSALIIDIELIRWFPFEFCGVSSFQSTLNELKSAPVSAKHAKGAAMTTEVIAAINQILADAVKRFEKEPNPRQMLRILRQVLRELDQVRIDAKHNPADEKKRLELKVSALQSAAECAYAVGAYPSAISLCRDLLQMRDDDAATCFLLGRAQFACGHLQSAFHFVRRAHLLDLSNPRYEQKLEDIKRHQTLFTDFDDPEDELDDCEVLAEMMLSSLKKNKKLIVRKVIKTANAQLAAGAQEVVLEGGFTKDILDDIEERINSGAQDGILAKRFVDSLTIYVS